MKLTFTALIAAGSAALGFVAGQVAAPSVSEHQPSVRADEIVDLLPEDMVTMILNDEQRPAFLSVWESIGPSILAAYAPTPEKFAALPSFPVGSLVEPNANAAWPEGIEIAGRDALDGAKEHWTVLNFWASWCAPCIAELPDIEAAANALAEDNIRIIPINVDREGGDTLESARALYAQRGVEDLPLVMATNKADRDALLVRIGADPEKGMALPYNIIFAPGGRAFAAFSGGSTDDEPVWASKEGLAFFRALNALEIE